MKLDGKFAKLLVCLLAGVLALFMTVEAAHHHVTSETASGTHCQICSMAHIAIDTHPGVFTAYVLHTLAAVKAGEPLTQSRLVVFTGFIRPPPAKLPFVTQ
jgi:hypothetical protein